MQGGPKRLGVGVIGTGWVAGAHIENFRAIADGDVVAICSRDRDRAQRKIVETGATGAVAYDDLQAFLRHDGLDVVSICTPHPNHPQETIAAADAGKHIVIEKPLCMNPGELTQMVAAVAAAGVQTSVCFELRWMGLIRNIKAILDQGLIGKVFYGETSYFHGCGPWYPQWQWNIQKKMGGNALLTAGCHALDVLMYLIGSRVTSVCAMSNTSAANELQYEYDPNSVAILRFADGSLGKVATSVECRQPYLFPILLQGEAGSIWNDQLSTLSWPGQQGWARIPAAMPDSGDVGDHPYRSQFEDFFDCIHTGRRPHNDLASCAHSHEVIFAVEQALMESKTVDVERTART